MKISVIGCGYLGAVHAASMAHLGHDVIGIDVDAAKVAELSAGRAPFFEPGLPALLEENIAAGRLRFSTDMAEVAGSAVHFVAVGTPQVHGGSGADLSYVNSAFSQLLPHLVAGDLVVGKSTVPVGTAERLATDVIPTGAELAWNPEFLREGFAVQDTIAPDRLVYGVRRDEANSHSLSGRNAVEVNSAVAILNEVYSHAVANSTPLVVTDYATAELVKVAANAFLATKISFINAMAEIAEVTGADVTELADAIGYDARIGRKFLNAGVGFGGGCLPKDIRAFTARAEELGCGQSVAFLKEVDAINMRRRDRVIELIEDSLGGSVYQKKVAMLGLAFKPNSDDIRDSPALDVAVRLHGLGAVVVSSDPQAIENSKKKHPQLVFGTVDEALEGAEILVIATEWQDYTRLDPAVIADRMSTRIVVDARNCLDALAWRRAGWTYVGLGRR